MRLYLLIFILLPTYISAQFWISGVSTSPNPVNDCDHLVVTVDGNLSSSNCTHQSSFSISGNTITIDILVSCGGIGLPVITPYTATISIGNIPSNTYALVVNQYQVGNLQETNTSSLQVGSCCGATINISNLNSFNCVGESTSFVDGGTMADSLIWKDNGSPFSPFPSALGWIYAFQDTGLHQITLIAYDTSGCTDTAYLAVTINPLPEVITNTIPASCNTCMDGEASITVVSGPVPHQLVWSIGGSSNPLTGLNPGDYGFSFTDGNTCTIYDTVTVGNTVGMDQNLPFITCFPNPTNGLVEIRGLNKDVQIEVYNFEGKFIKLCLGSSIDLSNLSTGIYNLNVIKDESIFNFKVVKQ